MDSARLDSFLVILIQDLRQHIRGGGARRSMILMTDDTCVSVFSFGAYKVAYIVLTNHKLDRHNIT